MKLYSKLWRLIRFSQNLLESAVVAYRNYRKIYAAPITKPPIIKENVGSKKQMEPQIRRASANLPELQSKLISCKTMTPTGKGFAGIILFKIENNFSLDQDEEKFLEELHLYLKIPS